MRSLKPQSYGSNDQKYPPGVDMAAARDAYKVRDVEASKAAHSSHGVGAPENHQEWGDYLKAVQFGGLDGILTSFSIVASAAGSGLSWQGAITIALSTVAAAALSMGIGEFLSEKAEVENIFKEKDREEWEVEKNKDGEIAEMIDIFKKKGLDDEDAEMVITTIAKHEEFFVNTMMSQELGMQVPDDDWKWEAAKSGMVMFCSFVFFGVIPVVGYIVVPAASPTIAAQHHSATLFIIACVVTTFALFILGVLGSKYSNSPFWVKGLETVLLGSVCAGIAYSVSALVATSFSSHAAAAASTAAGG